MKLLALDPGLRGVGVAYFDGPRLVYANYLSNPVEGDGPAAWFALGETVHTNFRLREFKVDVYVCEVPQIYRVSKGDPNDLIQVAGVAAAVGAMFPVEEAYGYWPRSWKGTQKKETHHPLILKQLDSEETDAIEEKRKTLVHNVIDAVGLGLFHLERKRIRMRK